MHREANEEVLMTLPPATTRSGEMMRGERDRLAGVLAMACKWS